MNFLSFLDTFFNKLLDRYREFTDLRIFEGLA